MNNKRKDIHSFANTRSDPAGQRRCWNGINKPVATICNEEGVHFQLVFYVLFFHAVFINNK